VCQITFKISSTEAVKNLDEKKKVAALPRDFPDVFAKDGDDAGRTDLAKHSIDTGDSKRLRQAPRRLPIGQREEVTMELAQVLQRGLIEPSSCPWTSGLVPVRKKDGPLRICVDYRPLNSVTKKERYPLQRIDDSLEALYRKRMVLHSRSEKWVPSSRNGKFVRY
jgi:hypothetical protein